MLRSHLSSAGVSSLPPGVDAASLVPARFLVKERVASPERGQRFPGDRRLKGQQMACPVPRIKITDGHSSFNNKIKFSLICYKKIVSSNSNSFPPPLLPA